MASAGIKPERNVECDECKWENSRKDIVRIVEGVTHKET